MEIKVIQLLGGFSDGGAETVVKDYVCYYKKNIVSNYKVDPIAVTIMNETTTANYKQVKNAGVKIISIYRKYNIVTKILRELFGKYYVPYKLKKIIEKERPNVLHVHTGLLHFLLPIVNDLNGIKLIYTCHSIPDRYLGKERPDENAAVKILIKQCGLEIIALQSEMKKEIDEMFGISNTKVLYNGIDVSNFAKDTFNKYDERNKIALPTNAFVIGHVGRFSMEKNHLFLLDVFKQYTQVNNNAFLLLVGWGKMEKQIKNKMRMLQIENRCKILSHRTDIPQILSTMDVFIFPSLIEGLGNAFVEAQIAGLKCIKSDNVPDDTIIADNTSSLSLEDSLEDWCCAIDNDKFIKKAFNTKDDFLLTNIMIKLTQIYID